MQLTYSKVLLFGDSITQMGYNQDLDFGFGGGLTEDYIRKMDVIDRGFSGYNSDHAKVLLPAILNAETNVKLLTIFFGTNDAATNFQGVPLERYIANLRFLINYVKTKDIKLIIIGPALHDKKLDMQGSQSSTPWSSNVRTKTYSDNLQQLCEELDTPFINLWQAFKSASGISEENLLQDNYDNLSAFLTDGIHFTGKSYKILHDKILDTVKLNYPELHPENLPMLTPRYDDIDYDNIEECLSKYFT